MRECFPGKPVVAYFEFAPLAGSEISRAVQDAVALSKIGVQLDLKELSEKTGYSLTQTQAVLDPP